MSHEANKTPNSSELDSDSSGDEDTSDGKWKLDLAWLNKALEPATQLRRWALPTGLYSSCSLVFDS